MSKMGTNFKLMGYFVQGEFDNHTNRHPYNIKARLVASIAEVFATMDKDMVRSACSKFRGRIEAIIEANGDFIA